MTTHVRLVSTIDVATVPRHLNAALNWLPERGWRWWDWFLVAALVLAVVL